MSKARFPSDVNVERSSRMLAIHREEPHGKRAAAGSIGIFAAAWGDGDMRDFGRRS
jgi:hypothetical protein